MVDIHEVEVTVLADQMRACWRLNLDWLKLNPASDSFVVGGFVDGCSSNELVFGHQVSVEGIGACADLFELVRRLLVNSFDLVH